MRGFKKVFVLMLAFLVCLMMVAPAAATSRRCRVLIGFEGNSPKTLVRNMGGKVVHSYKHISAMAVEMPETAIAALAANPRITYIELDHKVQVLQQVLPWGVDRIDAEIVHSYNKGAGVNICIIDTGIDYNHPDLDDNYVGGIDYVNNDFDPMDDNGHGTHCAGIVAAENNDFGVVGVAPEASLCVVKALDSSGSGYLSDVVAGIEWAVENDMDVISMSLGSDSSSLTLEDACNNAYASGLILVAAAGNDGNPAGKTDSVDYPARYSSVVAVAATNDADARATWSSTGPDLEFSAPGISIYSTYLNGGYATGSGTSMACPHVVGTVALAKIAYPAYTNIEIRSLLQNTADDLGTVGLDIKYGYGLVDADEAAPDVGPDITPPTISNLMPADGSVISTGSPTISAAVSDASGIDEASIVMTVDETVVVHTYNSITGIVSYTVPDAGPLAEGSHTVTLVVADTEGNSTSTSWFFTVDITPPAQVTNVIIATVSGSQLDVAWTANTESDLDYYNVYRSTTSGGQYELVASQTTNSYSDTGLTALTTYYYVITAVDMVGNEGLFSAEASGTTCEVPTNTMHVLNINMTTKVAGINTTAIATVSVVDADGNLLEGAIVSGHWSGLTSDSDVGITDTSGQTSLASDRIKRASGIFTFMVDDITLNDWTYDAGANVETSDSITVP